MLNERSGGDEGLSRKLCLLDLGPNVLERNGSIKHRGLGCGIKVGTEVSEAFKLESGTRRRFLEAWFCLATCDSL